MFELNACVTFILKMYKCEKFMLGRINGFSFYLFHFKTSTLYFFVVLVADI